MLELCWTYALLCCTCAGLVFGLTFDLCWAIMLDICWGKETRSIFMGSYFRLQADLRLGLCWTFAWIYAGLMPRLMLALMLGLMLVLMLDLCLDYCLHKILGSRDLRSKSNPIYIYIHIKCFVEF